MKDWHLATIEMQRFLHARCRSKETFDFWDRLFHDLTGMYDGLFDDYFENDPVVWYVIVTADDTDQYQLAWLARRQFLDEAHERGYDL